MNLEYERGLIIVYPYGSFIRRREKNMIVKTKRVESIIEKPLLLIEDKLGLGLIVLSQPVKINLKQFRALYKYHLITELDREKWWPSYRQLYAYDIVETKFFRYPILLDYGTGPQITVKPENISFAEIMVGMSGYYYKNMYSAKNKDLLDYYSKNINSVEINSTFYKFPSDSTVKNLGKYDLAYSIKVNQYITHRKKLLDISDYWKKFYTAFEPIYHQIFCFLFQFSAKFYYNRENFNRLRKLSKYLKPRHHYAFEFRDTSWFNDDVIKLFHRNNWIIVITNVNNHDGWAGNLITGFNPPLNKYIATSDAIYIRMHGSQGEYIGSYNNHTYTAIQKLIIRYNPKYAAIYFNNTDLDANAMENAITFYNKFNKFNTF